MSQGLQSPGGRAATGSAAQSGSLPLRAAPAAAACAHTAALADAAALDLESALELIDELIGNGSDQHQALNALRALLAGVGAMVEVVALSHGGKGCKGGPMHWLYGDGDLVKAMKALEPIAQAATKARAAADLCQGGAA